MDEPFESTGGIGRLFCCLCVVTFFLPALGAYGESGWAGPESVLVVFNERWPDEDGNGKSDSRDVAEYYAARRGVPSSNLLSVRAATDYTIDYRDFYNDILTPVHRKLETASHGLKLSKTIYYIVTCYGVPVCVDTHMPASANPFGASHLCHIRSLDQFLMDVERQMQGGVSPLGEPQGTVGKEGKLLGDSRSEVKNHYANAVSLQTRPKSIRQFTFKSVRDRGVRIQTGSYLVTRLDGPDAEIAKGLVDSALYAEAYLKPNPPPMTYRMQVVIDSDEGRRHGHERSAAMMHSYLSGALLHSPWHPESLSPPSEPFFKKEAGGGVPASPFELITDWGVDRKEVGEQGHLPTVQGIIASVTPDAVTLKPEPSAYGIRFFSPGMTVSSGKGGSASVTGVDLKQKRLILDNTAPFTPGETVTWQWEGTFPLSPAFIYTFYKLGAYRDVYTFLPGALGKHMDSASARDIRSADGGWAARALIRNIASTQGAVAEPFSTGEARMDAVMAALSLGTNAADAWYNGLTYGNRWMGVVISDPLYAPLRDLEKRTDDVTPPKIGRIEDIHISPSEREIRGALADTANAEPEVCRFTVEYGPDAAFGKAWHSFFFPGPFDGTWQNERRCRYSRRFSCRLSGLEPGKQYHYRVTATDPYGNKTRSNHLIFTAGQP